MSVDETKTDNASYGDKIWGKKKPGKWFSRLVKNLPAGIKSIELIEENKCNWLVRINGPDDSLYKGGTFEVHLNFSNDFPLKPPKIIFDTCIFHMNVTSKGHICLDIIEGWKSNKTLLTQVFDEIFLVLKEPMLDSPINDNAFLLFTKDEELYKKTAISWTKKFAIQSDKDETQPISFIKARQLMKKQISNNNNKNENEDNKDDEKVADKDMKQFEQSLDLDKIVEMATVQHGQQDPMFVIPLYIVEKI